MRVIALYLQYLKLSLFAIASAAVVLLGLENPGLLLGGLIILFFTAAKLGYIDLPDLNHYSWRLWLRPSSLATLALPPTVILVASVYWPKATLFLAASGGGLLVVCLLTLEALKTDRGFWAKVLLYMAAALFSFELCWFFFAALR